MLNRKSCTQFNPKRKKRRARPADPILVGSSFARHVLFPCQAARHLIAKKRPTWTASTAPTAKNAWLLVVVVNGRRLTKQIFVTNALPGFSKSKLFYSEQLRHFSWWKQCKQKGKLQASHFENLRKWGFTFLCPQQWHRSGVFGLFRPGSNRTHFQLILRLPLFSSSRSWFLRASNCKVLVSFGCEINSMTKNFFFFYLLQWRLRQVWFSLRVRGGRRWWGT